MLREVPFALRLSGHLLFGLVKIYSLMVKYLIQDCNRMVDDIRTTFTLVQVNLLVYADRALFESVTLPNILDLDAVDLELDGYQIDEPDNHRITNDQITLQDEILFERGQYVSIFINKDPTDARINSSTCFKISNSSARPMEEDTLPPFEDELDDLDDLGTCNKNGTSNGDLGSKYLMKDNVLPPFEDELDHIATPTGNVMGGTDIVPNNQTDTSAPGLNEGHFSDETPESLRDVVHSSQLEWGDTANDFTGVHEQSIPSLIRNGNLSTLVEGLSVSGQQLPDVELQPSPVVIHVELQPSPAVDQNVRNKRKRKQYFDRSIVLTNALISDRNPWAFPLVMKCRTRASQEIHVRDLCSLQKQEPKAVLFLSSTIPLLTTPKTDAG